MEQAIKRAIEGGWINSPRFMKYDGISHLAPNIHAILFDPLFWQSLGKAEGWEEWLPTGYFDKMEYDIEDIGWKVHWHRFIDHLAENETVNPKYRKPQNEVIDSFFKELLK